jgi:hypothetical protein
MQPSARRPAQPLGCRMMKSAIRIVSFTAGAIVAVVVATEFATFLEWDNCADAGGLYNRASGACSVDDPEYVPMFSRVNWYPLCCGFLGASFLSGWLVYRTVVWFGSRLSAAHQAVGPEDGRRLSGIVRPQMQWCRL